jgi:hypothetical protein
LGVDGGADGQAVPGPADAVGQAGGPQGGELAAVLGADEPQHQVGVGPDGATGPWTTPITPPPCRCARCWSGCPPATSHRCLSSTAATTPPSSPSTWPTPAAVLVRLRSDRCFYADPPPQARSPKGCRPRRHGAKFNCADPATWPAPTATLVCQDDQYGAVTVAAWAGLHPNQQRHPGHGTRRPRPIVRGTVIRVQVERVPAKTRPPKVLWLWWVGPGELDLDLAWRAYVRRFDLEHTVRFCKQTLSWATPRPRHPEQAERWTWLVLAAYAQLRLARQVAGDQRLPWERPRPQPRLSPVRVRRGFPQLLVRLGSPASAPKPAGCPPGRPKGRCSGPARRYPAIKKPTRKPPKKQTKTAKAA